MDEKKKGAILSYIGIVLKVLIAFVFTPFLISSLGKSEYGIFNIVGSFAAYLAILDFGINDSTVRYLVRQRKLGQVDEGNDILGSISFLYLGIGAAIIAAGTILYFNLDYLLGESFTDVELNLLKTIFIITFASTAFTIIFNPITALLVAYERFVLIKGVEISAYLISTGVIVLYLILGYNVIAVVAISATVNITGILFKLFYVFKYLKIRFKIGSYSSFYLKELFGYAAPIFLVVLVEQIYWKLDNIIIGSKLGPSIVAVYAIGIFFQKYLLSFSTAISRVMIPKMILEVEEESSSQKLTDTLVKISRYQLLIVLIMITGLVFFGKEFIILWLGEEFEISYYVMICVLIPFAFEIVGNIRNTIMQVKKLYWYRSVLILLISLINVVLTVTYVEEYGIVIAGFFTGAALIVGYIGVHIILQWKVNISFVVLLQRIWSKAILVVLLCAIVSYLLNFIPNGSWLLFLLKIIPYIISYCLLVWSLYLNEEEKKTISLISTRIQKAIKIKA